MLISQDWALTPSPPHHGICIWIKYIEMGAYIYQNI